MRLIKRVVLLLMLPWMATAWAWQAAPGGAPLAEQSGVGLPLNAGNEQAVAADLKHILAEDGTGSVLFLTQDQREYAFANVRSYSPTRQVSKGALTYPLRRDERSFDEVRYEVDGARFRIAEYLSRTATRGVIVIRDDTVLLEHYAPGHSADTRWMSFSVSKSITSLLIGAAIKDGYISDVNDPVTDYLPQLRSTPYDGTTIHDLLQMSSGVEWNEDYTDPASDVARAGTLNGIALINYLGQKQRLHPPGSHYNYNTGETNLVGQLLRAAIGNNASTYLQRKIWQPFGMESDAWWVLDQPDGAETGGCCLNATLRDYARIGLFALAEGRLADGTSVLPEGWIASSTAPSAANSGYGYLWWPQGDGTYLARGIFLQRIFVDPAHRIVIAMHNNALQATGGEDDRHVAAALQALRNAVIGD